MGLMGSPLAKRVDHPPDGDRHERNASAHPGTGASGTRPLDETPYVLLDARYERVREGGQVVDCAVLVAIGVTASGHRRVLGGAVGLEQPLARYPA